ncbi:arylsulfatase [Vibrio vulnificus]
MINKRKNRILTSLMVGASLLTASPSFAEVKQPNILIITADDMGFSDIGAFGSEIQTPTIDAIANDGLRFNNFYTNPLCTPTRTSLMSGVDHHRAGAGTMSLFTAPNQKGKEGYEGFLREEFVTLGDLMKNAGYTTFVSGKWDLGRFPELIPRARGFDRDFVMLDDHGSHYSTLAMWADAPELQFTEDGKYLTELPDNYYSSRTYTDKMLSFMKDNKKNDDKPFFAFLSYQAPHDPLHVDEPWRSMYQGQYDKGWSAVRLARYKKQKELGIIPEFTELAERYWYVPDSEMLAPIVRAALGRDMELYAGLMTNMDHHLNRVIQYLKETGEYDNTMILFFGDNGPEGNGTFEKITTFGTKNYIFKARNWSDVGDIRLQGTENNYTELDPGWAQVSASPFFGHKDFAFEGGIRNALVVKPAKGFEFKPGSIRSDFMHVQDIFVTLAEMTNQKFPNGYTQAKSWLAMLNDPSSKVRTADDWFGWESGNSRALRRGNWKISNNIKPWGDGTWKLYNLEKDLSERYDVSKENPKIFKELVDLYENEYVVKNNVILGDRTYHESDWWDGPLRFETGNDEGDEYPPGLYKKGWTPPAEMMAEPKQVEEE